MTTMTRASYVQADTEADAVERLHDMGCTDGLPVVVPTEPRVETMLLNSGGLDRDVVVGVVGPQDGEATVEKVAINAVMAGCRPEVFPIVLAAVEAAADPTFHLGPLQSTTHNISPVVIVHGPIRQWCGVASGTGALGPGHRANATIGRALRLVMLNIGGGRPGLGDMALLGHGGKFTACLGENEEESPFEPLHVARGLARDDSAVTIIGVEAPQSAVSVVDGDAPEASADRIHAVIGGMLAGLGTNGTYNGMGQPLVVINPDHARALASVGRTRRDVQQGIFDHARQDNERLHWLNPILTPSPEGESHPIRRPEDIIVVVAGGDGPYSWVMPTWAAGDGCVAITRPIRFEKACDVGGPVGT